MNLESSKFYYKDFLKDYSVHVDELRDGSCGAVSLLKGEDTLVAKAV